MSFAHEWPKSTNRLRNLSGLPIWLVWALSKEKNVILRAITFTEKRANMYRDAIVHEPNLLRAYVEKSAANHLYAGIFDVFSAKASARIDMQLRPGKKR